MTHSRPSERGEGKIGCIVTLLVVLILGGVTFKVFPVMWSNNSLIETAEDLATKAGILPKANLELQLIAKAKELEIPEAVGPEAMTVSVSGIGITGTCTIHLKYTRKVDLFGVYTLNIDTDKVISKPYMDAR